MYNVAESYVEQYWNENIEEKFNQIYKKILYMVGKHVFKKFFSF